MEVFTQGWNHRPYSPGRLDEIHDIHVDGPKGLIIVGGHERPAPLPEHVREMPVIVDAMSDAEMMGEISTNEFLLLIGPYARGLDVADRTIKIGDGAFDVQQIFDFCMAVILSEVIGWRVKKNEGPGFTLFLAGPEWVGCVASLVDNSEGVQVLP